MEKKYNDLKLNYERNRELVQNELLEFSSVIENAPQLLIKGYNLTIGGKSTCKCNCKCKGSKCSTPECSADVNNGPKKTGLEVKV